MKISAWQTFILHWNSWAYLIWLAFTTWAEVEIVRPLYCVPEGTFIPRMFGELGSLLMAFWALAGLQRSWRDFRNGLKTHNRLMAAKGAIGFVLCFLPFALYWFSLDVIGSIRHLRFGI